MFQRTCYAVILLVLFITSCTPIDSRELTYQNGVITHEGQPYSGKSYTKSGFAPIVELFFSYGGDSIVYDFDEGVCEAIDFYRRDQHVQEVTFEHEGDDVYAEVIQYQYIQGFITGKEPRKEAHYKNGVIHGQLTVWQENRGSKFGGMYKYTESTYEEGVQVGTGLEYYPNGNIRIERPLSDGEIHGVVKSYYNDGSLWKEEEHENGIRVSEIVYYRQNGALHTKKHYQKGREIETEEWSLNGILLLETKNGVANQPVKNGAYEFLNEHNAVTKVTYKQGKKQGKEEIFYSDGELWEVNHYNRGVLSGMHQKWYSNGELAIQVKYVNGKKEGLQEEWYDSGVKWTEINFKNGVEEGPYKRYYKNGEVGKTGQSKGGRRVGKCLEYYDDGKPWKELTYRKDSDGWNCKYVSWYTNGQMAEKYTTVNEVKHGLYKKWYESGQIRLEVQYHYGTKNGYYQNWLENGDLYRNWTFVNGNKQ